FGIKPIFYTRIGNAFAFASELKTLTALPGFEKKLNFDTVLAAINYLWVPGNESMFTGCFKLPPAHYAIIDTRDQKLRTQIRQYWKLDTTVRYKEEIQTTTLLRETVESSVKRHMIADVPVSTFLSGGLDSSLISAIASKVNPKLSSYTIGTTEEDKKVERMPEDEKYALLIAKLFNLDHHEIIIKPDILKELPAMVHTLDEPIGDPAAINTFLICKAARERGVKVLLSGMGADEILFGYRRHKATLMGARYRRLPGFMKSVIGSAVNMLPVRIFGHGFKLSRWGKRFLSFAELSEEESYMRSYSYYDQAELKQLFRHDITQSYSNLRSRHAELFSSAYPNDTINQICHTDISMFMLGLNLTYTDRASMAASVEVRVPFIDKTVVQTAMQISGDLKYKNGESKYILKKVAEAFLPQKVIYRPKASFGVPLRSWIGKDLKPLVDDLLSEANITKRGIFNPSFVKTMVDNDRKGTEDNAYRIYQLLTFEIWCRKFMD
ncbi:MAG: asparagine synthase (glutamine-hydrolyzing), partial [Chitinophagaceae bacterium]